MSTEIIPRTEGGAHWYTLGGEPRHEATLREARKEGLLPSVTTVGKSAAKPQLDRWKVEQAMIYTYNAVHDDHDRQRAGESTEEFLARVYELSQQQLERAGDRGTKIHRVIEDYLKGRGWDHETVAQLNDCARESMAAARQWFDDHLDQESGAVEEVAVHAELGYAGTVDYYGLYGDGLVDQLIVGDWKSRRVKNGNPFYDEDIRQLAAYRQALVDGGQHVDALITGVIATDGTPGFHIKYWSEADAKRGLAMFNAIHAYWREDKRFPFEQGQMEMF